MVAARNMLFTIACIKESKNRDSSYFISSLGDEEIMPPKYVIVVIH